MTFKQNVVLRMLGLFVFVAPKRGSAFLWEAILLAPPEQVEAEKRKAGA